MAILDLLGQHGSQPDCDQDIGLAFLHISCGTQVSPIALCIHLTGMALTALYDGSVSRESRLITQ